MRADPPVVKPGTSLNVNTNVHCVSIWLSRSLNCVLGNSVINHLSFSFSVRFPCRRSFIVSAIKFSDDLIVRWIGRIELVLICCSIGSLLSSSSLK
jgi:hypothetical protein